MIEDNVYKRTQVNRHYVDCKRSYGDWIIRIHFDSKRLE